MHKLYDSVQVDEMNPEVLSGIARELGKDTVGFVDSLWKQSLKALPKKMIEDEIFVYKGYSIVPIHERTLVDSKKIIAPGKKVSPQKLKYSINLSDDIPVIFKFAIKNNGVIEEAYLHISVVYIRRNSLCKLSGTLYQITPILSDILITPDKNGVFVKPDSIKFKISTSTTSITYLEPKDSRFKNKLTNIVISDQMRGGSKPGREKVIYGSPKTPIHLYIVYRYGLKEAYGKEIHIIKNSEIEDYHAKGYYIYSVNNNKPKGHLKWSRSEYSIAVKKEPDKNNIKLIASVLQVLYYFPKSGEDMCNVIGTKEEEGFWSLAIGRMIYKGLRSEEFMLREVRNLFIKFQTYISGRIASKLAGIGFTETTDFFCFLREMLEKLDDMKASHLEYINSFSYREIDIYYYLLYPYIESINKIINSIAKEYKNSGNFARTNFYGITNTEHSKKGMLRKISKAPIALTLSKAEASSDNLFFKMSSNMIPQEVGKGVNRKRSNKNPDIIPKNMQGLHGSFPYLGNLLKLPKGTPVALASINPFLKIDKFGKFIFSKDDIKTMEEIDVVLNEEIRDITNESLIAGTDEAEFEE